MDKSVVQTNGLNKFHDVSTVIKLVKEGRKVYTL